MSRKPEKTTNPTEGTLDEWESLLEQNRFNFEEALARAIQRYKTETKSSSAKNKLRERATRNDPYAEVKRLVREYHSQGRTDHEICQSLDALDRSRPAGAKWKDLKWARAHRNPEHKQAVKTWLNKAKHHNPT